MCTKVVSLSAETKNGTLKVSQIELNLNQTDRI